MGNKYEVLAWTETAPNQWRNVPKYSGEWLVAAMLVAIKLKRQGCGCVSLKWR